MENEFDSQPCFLFIAVQVAAPGKNLIQRGIRLGVFAGVFFLAHGAFSSDVVFHDGKVLKGVTAIKKGDTYVITMEHGTVQFPKAAIKSIDGKPLVTPTPAPMPSSPPEVSASATPFVRKTEPAPAPAATPETAEAPAAAPTPASPVVAAESPAPTATPQASPAAAKAAAGFPTGPTRASLWNFELVILGLLILMAVWMRSLQWVQLDLYERRSDPRFWTAVAMLVPGIGALVYSIVMKVADRRVPARAPIGGAGGAPAEKGRFPWLMPPPDPNMHLASKGKTRQGFEFLDTERKSIQLSKDRDLSSGLNFACEMLEEAIMEHASDVHIEPSSTDYRVRFRLDGIMHERMSYDSDDGRRVVTSLKTLAQIDVAEKRKAQDGHFRAKVNGREVDFRVATANSIHGEKMVIRVLDHSHGVFDLTTLGMSDDMLAIFQNTIHSRNGMILATGPTGSGKTSTLYAALRQLDSSRLNIMTIEDPAEYELDGATQIAVNPKAGITYESGLRSILRQDPDVILVGEMRDREATEVALRAALTGHLVLSSLHTKDAVGTISRLQDMGIERYQVASALLMIVAQRLVRVLCSHCREPYEAKGDELDDLGISFDPGVQLYASKGCDKCLSTGFQGRTGLFELLVLDEDLRKAVSEGADEDQVKVMAQERGFRSYRYDGAEKVLLGVTTVEEVLGAV